MAPNPSKLRWYWNRLLAMRPKEMALRGVKKLHQVRDARYSHNSAKFASEKLEPSRFPILPERQSAPPDFLRQLAIDTEEILAGRWKFFGHLSLQVDDPPKWHKDYLVGEDFRSNSVGFKLDHRAQPRGGDIKIIWEPSRWYQLTRLAEASWLLRNGQARVKCIEWLRDWSKNNPPFRGLNWTSALETGIRLVNYTWIDAMLGEAGAAEETLLDLRRQIVPPHLRFTWRYKSFGSSANNHLIGELAGLIVALVRWPNIFSKGIELTHRKHPIAALVREFEKEVLLQFASDGGNQEQALGYHLFSWEFCWQTLRVLKSAGFSLHPEVETRLIRAGEFHAQVKDRDNPWDYGDSDNAYVTPFFKDETNVAEEWRTWFEGSNPNSAISFWWGKFPSSPQSSENGWKYFPESGYAIFKSDDWFLRWDLSPLGYLSMAPHGHLDALNISISYKGKPLIIDPGTGAYYADKSARNYLADWSAHNGPFVPGREFPKRYGTFLWSKHHAVPQFQRNGESSVTAYIELPHGRTQRTIHFLPEKNGWMIEDRFADSSFNVNLKFGPDWRLQKLTDRNFSVISGETALLIALRDWESADHYNPPAVQKSGFTLKDFPDAPLASIASPAFRRLISTSYLNLKAPAGSGLFQTVISPQL